MRKIFIGLLLAATAASPALADKGGHGRGHGGHPHGNAHGAGKAHGGKHAGPAKKVARTDFHGNGHAKQAVRARSAPIRVVRFEPRHAQKGWKREAKAERKVARQWQKDVRPARRIVRAEHSAPARVIRYAQAPRIRYVERPAVRYVQPTVVRYAPAPVRYVSRSYAPDYYQQPIQRYRSDRSADYWPGSYGVIQPAYDSGVGALFGSGGNGILGALLPVVLQSVVGGHLGGFGTLGNLGATSALDSLTGLGTPDVLPLEQASYAPYANGGTTDLASLLLPSLLGNGSLF